MKFSANLSFLYPELGFLERFAAAVKRLGLNRLGVRLDTSAFHVPESARTALVDAKRDARQMRLL